MERRRLSTSPSSPSEVAEKGPQLRSRLESILNVARGYAFGFSSPAASLDDIFSSLQRSHVQTVKSASRLRKHRLESIAQGN